MPATTGVSEQDFIDLVARHQPISGSELARKLGVTPGAIYHRMRKLRDRGIFCEEERVIPRTATQGAKKAIYYSIANDPPLEDDGWQPATQWVHPYRRSHVRA